MKVFNGRVPAIQANAEGIIIEGRFRNATPTPYTEKSLPKATRDRSTVVTENVTKRYGGVKGGFITTLNVM